MSFSILMRKGLIALVSLLVLISGCAYVPTKNISFITSSGGKLFFSMSGGRIRALDKKTLKWNDAPVPDMKEPIIRNAKGELWAVGEDYKTCRGGGKCVYRINKADLKSTTVPMPSGITIYPYNWNYHNSNILRPFNPFYEDDDSLWLFAERPRKVFTPSGCCVPYLVRISKKDMTSQMIMIEPTAGEAFKTVLANFIGWLLVPFLRS